MTSQRRLLLFSTWAVLAACGASSGTTPGNGAGASPKSGLQYDGSVRIERSGR
ncbi:MAG: hypothetical protein RL199_2333 [Pseudomonadota bacterium]|jgi:hypothetical protein